MKDRLFRTIHIGDTLFWDAAEIFRHKSITTPRGRNWVEGTLRHPSELLGLQIHVTQVSQWWATLYPVGSFIDYDCGLNTEHISKWRKLASADWWEIWGPSC